VPAGSPRHPRRRLCTRHRLSLTFTRSDDKNVSEMMIDVIRSMCRVDLSCLDLTRYSPLPSIPLARLLLLQQVLPAAAQPPDGRIACCRCRLLSSPTSTHSRAIFATSKLVRGKSSGATSWRAHSNRRAQLKFRAVRESFSRYFNTSH